jgi:hypothetical protein
MKTNEVKFESLVELSLKQSGMGLTLAKNELCDVRSVSGNEA